MSNVGYATLTVLPSAKGFASALSGQVNAPMASAGKDGGNKAGGAFAGAFKSLVAPALAFASVAAIGGFVTGAISAAGDLEQSVGAIETVFKGSSGQMLQWSASAASSVGLTKNEFNELGTLIGSQLKNGGTAMDELAPKTQSLIGLGADMASMFGGSTSEAVSALSSALKGERDPIEKYGVSLTQAAIDAKAAELGFSKVGGVLSQEANQAATLALIMEQTGDAHGNFAKEANTMAGQQQRLVAGWGNLKTSIGSAFLPVLTTTMGFLNTNVMPGLQAFADSIGNGGLAGKFQPVIGAVRAFGAAWKANDGDVTSSGLAGVAEQIANAFRPLFGPLGDFKTLWGEVTGGIKAFGAAWKANDGDVTSSGIPGFFEQVANAVRPVWDSLGGLIPQVLSVVSAFSPLHLVFAALQPVLPALLSAFSSLGSTITGVLGVALTYLTPLVQTVVNILSGVFLQAMPAVTAMVTVLGNAFTQLTPVLMNVFNAVMPLVFSLLNSLAPIITDLVASILPPLVSIFGNVVNAIGPLVQMIAGLLVPVIQALLPVVVTVFQAVANIIKAAMQIAQGVIQVVTGLISGNWDQVWSGMRNIVGGIWNGITALVSGAIRVVQSVIVGTVSAISGIWNSVWSGILSFLGGIWNGITSAASNGINGLMGWIGGLGGRIMGAVSNIPGLLIGVGRDLIAGLANGIMGAAGMIRDAVANAIGNVVDFAKSLLGIHSPSRVFMEIGGFTAKGMAIGLTKGAKYVQKAAQSLIPEVPAFRSPEVAGGGIQGALATVAANANGTPQAPIHQENHFNVPMSEEAYAELAARKLLRAGVGR